MLIAAGSGAGLLGAGYVLRGVLGPSAVSDTPGDAMAGRPMGPGMMGSVPPADMRTYMEMFSRHDEIRRVVEEIPGGVRTTTECASPDLVAQLQGHVSSMYDHVERGVEINCMSESLPTLFRYADDYRRHLSFTPTGVVAEETSNDPDITRAIRAHAVEVSGFVRDGMPAMMNEMMRPGR